MKATKTSALKSLPKEKGSTSSERITVSLEDNDFIFDTPLWVVELSDGTTVYRDDEREGRSPKSAWLRLKKYIIENKLKVKNLYLKFRSNEVHFNFPFLESQGVFFSKRLMAGLTGQFDCFMVGYIKDNVVNIETYSVPELKYIDNETRPLDVKDERIILHV